MKERVDIYDVCCRKCRAIFYLKITHGANMEERRTIKVCCPKCQNVAFEQRLLGTDDWEIEMRGTQKPTEQKDLSL